MKDFDLILDDCLDRLGRGQTVEDCLATYPGRAGELRPMLQAALRAKDAAAFTPRPQAKDEARRRFNMARAERQGKAAGGIWRRLAFSAVALAATAAVVVLAVLGYNALQPGVSTFVPSPSPQGNFVFQISDAANAIGDFSSLYVTIDQVGVLGSSGWIEFAPETSTVDLVTLPGAKTQAIWRGDMPEGDYSKVFIYVSAVEGILESTGQPVDVKLPGNKLQISHDFNVSTGNVTSFTFDITVIATGNPNHGVSYKLNPQADQSGASTTPASH